MTTLVLTSTGTAAANLGNYKDPVIPSAGMKFLFDIASPVGWAKQATPANGDNVIDYANAVNGSILIPSGQSVAWSGGGFDFTGVTADGEIVRAPTGVLGSIYSATNDYFMVVMYAKLAASGDWNAVSTLAPMFCTTTAELGYTVEPDLLTIAAKTGNIMSFRRQTSVGTAVATEISAANHNGKVTQLAFWRNASGIGARLRSAGGVDILTAAVGSDNSADFSAQVPRFGVCESFNNLASYASHVTQQKYRLYRGWIEDLSASGRNPLTVLDDDYARVVARGAFS